jgi:putative endonuclease
MTFWVYIVQSQSTARFYCGQTNDLELRLRQHNDQEYTGTKTTKRFKGPWRLIWSIKCSNCGEAVKLERSIKKRGIGLYLREDSEAE